MIEIIDSIFKWRVWGGGRGEENEINRIPPHFPESVKKAKQTNRPASHCSPNGMDFVKRKPQEDKTKPKNYDTALLPFSSSLKCCRVHGRIEGFDWLAGMGGVAKLELQVVCKSPPPATQLACKSQRVPVATPPWKFPTQTDSSMSQAAVCDASSDGRLCHSYSGGRGVPERSSTPSGQNY